jgi:two-component sensor histidine kinase
MVRAARRDRKTKQEPTMAVLAPQILFADEPLLLDELNHRIINEFTNAIGMISRAAARSGNDEVKDGLDGAAQLLHNYAEVHRALQPPGQEALINAEAYLSRLCRAISRSKLDHMNIKLVVAASPLLVCAGRCWRLGMIVSELITNATLHAFADRQGEIRVGLSRSGAFITCSVTDNGSAPGLVRPGRGLRIIAELSRTLEARFERKFSPSGSTSTLIFPSIEPSSQTGSMASAADLKFLHHPQQAPSGTSNR